MVGKEEVEEVLAEIREDEVVVEELDALVVELEKLDSEIETELEVDPSPGGTLMKDG